MRLQGSTTPVITSEPARQTPDSRPARSAHQDRAHRLDQNQADPPRCEQRFEGTPVQPANYRALHRDSDESRHRKRNRNRDEQVPVEERRVAKQSLYNVRRVSADHDQLTVRHVDDTHQSIGDREAERSEQQDRAKTHAGEDNTEALTPCQTAFDLAQTSLRFDPQFFIFLGLEKREQQAFGIGAA
jgi:hypothetical protein